MFDDVNRTIAALLNAELAADVGKQVSISFATPDDSFPPAGLTLPAINFFLFEIRENTQLREVEATLERRGDGSLVRVPPAARVDCHYVVTAATEATLGSEQDELRILGATLKVLLRHRALPASVLQGVLVGHAPPIRALVAQQQMHPSGVELWQSLKGKPRATLHYTLTISVDTAPPLAAPGTVLTLNVGGT